MELDYNKMRAAEMELMGIRTSTIARQLEVHPNTVSGWKALPEYKAYRAKIEAEIDKSMGDILVKAGTEAANFLLEVLADYNMDMKYRMEAAKIIMEREPAGPTSNLNTIFEQLRTIKR